MEIEHGHEPICWRNLSIVLHGLPEQAAWMCSRKREAIFQAIHTTAHKITAGPNLAEGEAPTDLIAASVELTRIGLGRSDSVLVADGELVALLIGDKLHFSFFENGDPDPDPTSPKPPRSPLTRSTTPAEFVRALNRFLAAGQSASGRRLTNLVAAIIPSMNASGAIRCAAAAPLGLLYAILAPVFAYAFWSRQLRADDHFTADLVLGGGNVSALQLRNVHAALRARMTAELEALGRLQEELEPVAAAYSVAASLAISEMGGNDRKMKGRIIASYYADESPLAPRSSSLPAQVLRSLGARHHYAPVMLEPAGLQGGTLVAGLFRALFLSDLHLGIDACRLERLLDFLRVRDAGTIYVAGDTVSGWLLKTGWYRPQTHNDVIQGLLRNVRKGSGIVYIPTNHDIILRAVSHLCKGNAVEAGIYAKVVIYLLALAHHGVLVPSRLLTGVFDIHHHAPSPKEAHPRTGSLISQYKRPAAALNSIKEWLTGDAARVPSYPAATELIGGGCAINVRGLTALGRKAPKPASTSSDPIGARARWRPEFGGKNHMDPAARCCLDDGGHPRNCMGGDSSYFGARLDNLRRSHCVVPAHKVQTHGHGGTPNVHAGIISLGAVNGRTNYAADWRLDGIGCEAGWSNWYFVQT